MKNLYITPNKLYCGKLTFTSYNFLDYIECSQSKYMEQAIFCLNHRTKSTDTDNVDEYKSSCM